MKLSPVIYTPRGGLLFVVVLVMCCAILARISAMDETQVGQRRGDEQNFNGASADGTETGKLKQRERRRSTNNATPNLSDIEKRLKAIMEDRFNKSASLIEKRFQELEKRLDALLHVSPRPRDLYAPLMAYLLGPHGQNTGNQMKGPPGPPGKPGPAGKPGRAGKTGPSGKPGPSGKTGPSGKPGPSGKTGPAGKPGPSGKTGPAGKPGPSGKTGPAGKPGPSGKTGPAGAKGESGKPGSNRPVPGSPGPKGDQGAIGRTGAQGPQGAKGEKGQSGVKYVRWGRTTCPVGAQIVYKGIMGGEWYVNPGGGANYLCLPHNPKYDKYKNGYQHVGLIFGTEYQVLQYSGDPFKRRLHDHDAPCAVCYVKSRGSLLMMPARNDCPSGWTEEYHGYLMTAHASHGHPTDFVCVDKDPEYVPGSHANKDGALLYPVEGRCGSLPCLPYVEGRELTCAVCTK